MPSGAIPFPEFYSTVVECRNGCPGVLNDGHDHVPRGMFSRAVPGQLRLMVVLQNPGQPVLLHEAERYRGKRGTALAAEAWQLTGELLEGATPHLKSGAYDRMRPELAALLGVEEHRIFDHVLVTSVAHCSTPRNRAPNKTTVHACVRTHLRREIELWRPPFILAYGMWVYGQLQTLDIAVDDWLPAPAAIGKWLIPGVREEAVARVKSALEAKLHPAV